MDVKKKMEVLEKKRNTLLKELDTQIKVTIAITIATSHIICFLVSFKNSGILKSGFFNLILFFFLVLSLLLFVFVSTSLFLIII